MTDQHILFIWIPKNAGSSFFKLMQDKRNMRLYTQDYYNFHNSGSVTFGHLNVRFLLEQRFITQEYWNSALKIAITRNPYSRFASLYHDFLRSHRIAPDTTPHSFAHALRSLSRKPGLFNAMDYSQAASQVSWLLPGITLFKFETLQQDIFKMFGSEYVLPHENNSGTDYRMLYDEELQNMVYDLFYDAFVLLNYPKLPI